VVVWPLLPTDVIQLGLTNRSFSGMLLSVGGPRIRANPLASHLAVQTRVRQVEDGGGSTSQERAALSEFVVAKASKRVGYEAAWRSWVAYRESLPKPVRPDIFLRGLTKEAQVFRLGAYVMHLYQEGLRRDAVGARITKLKMVFLEALVDVEFFKADLVGRVKQATSMDPVEKAALEEKRLRMRSLPISMDIVWPVRDEYWVNQPWDCRGMDRRAVWLAIGLGFDSGARASNVTKQDGKSAVDHCIRAMDLSLTFHDGSGMSHRVKGGQDFRQAALDLSDLPQCVTKCEYHFRTGKVDMPEAWHTLARRSPQESLLLDDLVCYLVRSGVRAEDELFTRYPAPGKDLLCTRKSLTRREYRAGLTWAEEKAGLPSGSLKPSGLRRGCAETARATGATEAELRHGRWALGSTVPEKHYLASEEELVPGAADPSGLPASQGSFARASSSVGSFNSSHVKAIATSRGL
jgi:hypothetical protein